jgi:hypothetical protein
VIRSIPSSRSFAAAAALFLVSIAPSAQADSIIRDPNPPRYSVEVEPKLNFAPNGIYAYGGTVFGPGVRFSIPIMSPGFLNTNNDSVAISFGLDLMHYSGYRYYGNLGKNFAYYDAGDFWSVYLPVTLQWNFWLTERWSVFGEPGIALRHAFLSDAYCDTRFYACGNRDDFYFAFYVGGRYMLTDHLGLTMRLGHPTLFSIGLSIFP